MDVYFLSAVRPTRLVTPHMVAQKSGVIVNISTAWAFEPSEMFPTSAVFRAGLAAFTKVFADRYAPDNVRMNNILPGWIDSLPATEARRDSVPMRATARRRRSPARSPSWRRRRPATSPARISVSTGESPARCKAIRGAGRDTRLARDRSSPEPHAEGARPAGPSRSPADREVREGGAPGQSSFEIAPDRVGASSGSGPPERRVRSLRGSQDPQRHD